jgi:hypothetical protein
MRLLYAILVAFLIVCPGLALAHHTGASSSTSNSVILRGVATKPRPRFSLSYDLAELDASLGQLHTIVFGGEYTLKKWGFGLFVPIHHLAHNARPTQTSLGDVAGRVSFLLWDGKKSFGVLASQWSAPTGQEQYGLGSGHVTQQATLTLDYKFSCLSVFASVGLQGEYASEVEPILLTDFGVTSKRFLKKRLAASLIVSNKTFLHSDVFTAGSSQVLLEPQLSLFADEHDKWLITLSYYASILDTLTRQSGVTLTRTDNALLSDVLMGFRASVNYQFK